jgi:hypothetical protein
VRELYDPSADRDEWANLAAGNPDRARKMKRRKYAATAGSGIPSPSGIPMRPEHQSIKPRPLVAPRASIHKAATGGRAQSINP